MNAMSGATLVLVAIGVYMVASFGAGIGQWHSRTT